MSRQERLVIATFLVCIMLSAPIAGVVGATGGATSVATQDNSNDDFIEVTDDVSVWEKAALPLQADPHPDTEVEEIPWLEVNTADEKVTLLERSSVSVHNTTEEVTFSYAHSNVDTSQYEGDDVELLIGYLDENVSDEDVNLSDLPTTADELMDELSQENLDNLNNNVSFNVESATVGEDGIQDLEFTPKDSGFYTFVMAEGDGNFEVDDDNGDLENVNDARIIGAEQIVVHEEPSDVDVEADEPGDDVVFDIETDLDDADDVNHAVALYHADDFDDSSMTINVTEELSTDLSAEDVTIEHDIAKVNGVQSLESDVEFLGESIEERTVTGLVQFSDVITFLGTETELDAPETEVTGEDELDASSVAVVGNASETLTVETLGNWSEGDDYRWIHVATGSSSDQIQTATGVVTLEEEDTVVPGPPAPPAPTPDPKFDVIKAGLSDTKIDAGDSVDVTATIAETSEEAGGAFTAELLVDGTVVDEQDVVLTSGSEETVTFTRTFDEAGEYEIAINDVTAGTLTVSEKPPKPPAPGEPAFDVTDASLSETEIDVGDSVDVTATVENNGDESGTFTAELTVHGEVVDEEDVTVAPGASETVSFTESFDEAGEYPIGVSGTTAGTVTVVDDPGTLPGFLPSLTVTIAIIVALVLTAGALLAARAML